MKKLINFAFCICLLAFSGCSKDDEAAAAPGGCEFSFGGKSYKFTNAVCGQSQGAQTLSSTSGSQLLSMAKGGGLDGVTFSPNVSGNVTYFSSNAPSITISNGKWTFSSSMENVDTGASAGTLSGSCTCK